MKYGQSLRQRSIPAWSHYNIDYDDIKLLIKQHTSVGTGQPVSIPGKRHDEVLEFEHSLLKILVDQHDRIDLFVKSKVGEIQRRLEHSMRQLSQLAARQRLSADPPTPGARLERYSRLENDVVKAGDDIKSLARFIATQRTAFRKLLKKYKKWTGSTELEDRFRLEIFDNPKSFTKFDLRSLLDHYSITQQNIRALYDSHVQRTTTGITRAVANGSMVSSAVNSLRDALTDGSKVQFDTAIATLPLGDGGKFASYFVHPESVVELQMFLLEHARYYTPRSQPNSNTSPVSPSTPVSMCGGSDPEHSDHHMIVADSLNRIASEMLALPVKEREHLCGSCSSIAKLSIRWNDDEDALACLRAQLGTTKTAFLKKKHVRAILDKEVDFNSKTNTTDAANHNNNMINEIRRHLVNHESVCQLFDFSSCRSRFIGVQNDPDSLSLATLDTNIKIRREDADKKANSKISFPLGVLLVREEGTRSPGLISALDSSYLVERVYGFSMEYHALWQTHKSAGIPTPFWLPILSSDIRKLPPPAMSTCSNVLGDSGSIIHSLRSTDSTVGVTDSTTASEPVPLHHPRTKSSEKKKKKRNATFESPCEPQQRYWNEYDHPNDGTDENDPYMIYIDPDERSIWGRCSDRIRSLWTGRHSATVQTTTSLASPLTPSDDDSSSSDEEAGILKPAGVRSYGTLSQSIRDDFNNTSHLHLTGKKTSSIPHIGIMCFAASILILLAFIIALTTEQRSLRAVDPAVFFAIITSLVFSLGGFLSILQHRRTVRGGNHAGAWIFGVTLLTIDVLGSVALLVWMLGPQKRTRLLPDRF